MIAEVLSALKNANPNVTISEFKDAAEEQTYNRSLSGGNMSFSRNDLTVFNTAEMLKVTTVINKESRTYGAFAAKAGKKDLLISANAITRRLYTEDGDATNEKFQIKGITAFGDTPKEIVTNLIAKKKAIKCTGVEPLFAPRFVNGEAVYNGMIRRNYPVFEVVDAE